jgi:transposase
MNSDYSSSAIEHLGLVSAAFDDLGIGQIVDHAIPQDKQQIVSLGQSLKAMMIMGLGFTQRRLYLCSHFFENKPVDRLIGAGIEAQHLNDDTLGRALDAFYDFGVNGLFNEIAINTVKILGLTPKTVHDDITSFHVDGKYNSTEDKDEVEAAGLVRISQGYSRDSKPALNQVALELICEHQAGIPLAMRALSGCENDKTAFEASVTLHAAHLQSIGVRSVIKDSAGYTAQSLSNMKAVGQTWIMRVPNTIKATQAWLSEANLSEKPKFQPLLEGYTYQTRVENYGGIKQRWLLIHSQPAYKKELRSQQKRIEKGSSAECSRLKELASEEFKCEADARRALLLFEKKLKYVKVLEASIEKVEHFEKVGRPKKGSKAAREGFKLELVLGSAIDILEEARWKGSLFILGTNDLDEKELTDENILEEYKGQAKVESGFRFLKDPMFLASTIFLKSTKRIMALLMVMTVCLLVYAALEHRIRETLREKEATVPDQKGKATNRPTARWVFELMKDVHLLSILETGKTLTLNLRAEIRNLLRLLGDRYSAIYA